MKRQKEGGREDEEAEGGTKEEKEGLRRREEGRKLQHRFLPNRFSL